MTDAAAGSHANRDLHLRRGRVIPGRELRWNFGPSSGPGGQHANRAHTRAVLVFSVAGSSAFTDEEKRRIERRLGGRMRSGEVRLSVDGRRSQWRNRQEARERLKELLDEALASDPPPRRPTRPGPAARRKRLEAKRKRSETKRLRRPPGREPD